MSVAITAANGQRTDYDQLDRCMRSLPGVVTTWSSHSYTLAAGKSDSPTYVKRSDRKDDSDNVLTPAKENGNIPNGDDNHAVDYAKSSMLHETTGVQSLHDRNFTGAGVTIAIIDEGIDYLHPAFGGGFGANYTVQYGLDLVGDHYDADNEPLPDVSPFSECSFHGTHVTGIAAGRQEAIGFIGVAPDAKIEHFRILGCDSNAPIRADVVVDAILAVGKIEGLKPCW